MPQVNGIVFVGKLYYFFYFNESKATECIWDWCDNDIPLENFKSKENIIIYFDFNII